ncbi:GTP 3',8-cyclase MoaA [Bdellovibrio sp.]|uniref:GTP 3',8-cyclase MoaA n=1 Tax=Bdellovibrio sp. TaxID=28201 RepID=UPI0039E3B4C1
MSLALNDPQGRQFRYLRLSVTDVCNYRCAYCLPQGYKKCQTSQELTLSEIARLLRAFSVLSFKKLRLTGGEPTLRDDLPEIIREASSSGFQVGLTTNGYRLAQKVRRLKESGLSLLNVSLDSMSPQRFKMVTGKDELTNLQRDLDEALTLGFERIKINTVLLKGLNDDEFPKFLEYVKQRPITLRFIELMPTEQNKEFFHQHHTRSDLFVKELKSQGWKENSKDANSGPATEYSHEEFLGKIGFISPYAENFCAQCNRLRVSARGDLRLCLFGKGEVSLRDYLQDDESLKELVGFIQNTLHLKPVSHSLHEGDYGDMRTLSTYGG